MSMLPLVFPVFPNREEFDVYATLHPARQVGGDFYDFFFIDENRLCFCIGDVSGKGVPATLFMAVTKTLINSRTSDDFSTASVLTYINDELSRDNNASLFVSVFIGILDLKSGDLIYTNAGHNPPYIKRSHGSIERLDQRHGPVAGVRRGLAYKEERNNLSKGDMLLLYTDGVTRAMDLAANLFSEQRLAKLLSAAEYASVEELVQLVVREVKQFQGEAEQVDDITVLALQFLGRPEEIAPGILEMTVKNHLPEIDRVNQQFNAFAEQYGLPKTISRRMYLVFDELLNNVISYAYRDDNEHDIEIKVELSEDRLTVTIIDDGIPFNPFAGEAPDTELALEEREIGGLGIHLVRNMMDNVSYQRRIGKNIVTLVKHLDASNV